MILKKNDGTFKDYDHPLSNKQNEFKGGWGIGIDSLKP